MIHDVGFDEEFFYILKSDYELNKKVNRIDSFWVGVQLNKIGLIIIDNQEAFADVYTEAAFAKKNGFSRFKKKRI